MADNERAAQEAVVSEDSPGLRLKEARKSCDKSLADVSKELRLDRWMLEAIERDDFSALGAPVFAKGHLRQYAKHLNIDPDDLMVGYYQVCGSREQPPLLAESMLTAERGVDRSFAWVWPTILAVLVICAIGLGIYLFMQPTDEPTSVNGRSDFSDGGTAGTLIPITRSSEPADDQLALDPVTAGAAAELSTTTSNAELSRESSSTQQPIVRSPTTTTAVQAAQNTSNQNLSTNRSAEPSTTRSSLSSERATQRPLASSNRGVGATADTERSGGGIASNNLTVTLRFASESWAEIYDGGRQKLLYGMVQSATVKYLNGPPPISVFLGRQNAVSVEVNGEPYPIPVGAVRGNTARFQIDRP